MLVQKSFSRRNFLSGVVGTTTALTVLGTNEKSDAATILPAAYQIFLLLADSDSGNGTINAPYKSFSKACVDTKVVYFKLTSISPVKTGGPFLTSCTNDYWGTTRPASPSFGAHQYV